TLTPAANLSARTATAPPRWTIEPCCASAPTTMLTLILADGPCAAGADAAASTAVSGKRTPVPILRSPGLTTVIREDARRRLRPSQEPAAFASTECRREPPCDPRLAHVEGHRPLKGLSS